MRRMVFILLLGCIFFCISRRVSYAQATIRGRVVDASTGKPLARVNVFLSGTKMGTATSRGGHYQITEVPEGGYRLVISIVGYQLKTVDIIIGREESKEMNFKLKPVIYELPELYVGNFGEEWRENLERFTEHFIGRTGLADSVIILNPKVLDFETNWFGKLTAKAFAPLKIKNKALGYIITYYLKEFSQSGGLTKWDGEPFFTEMTPVDSAQAAYWEKNRRKAFYGSLRHFLLALIRHRVDEEGFILYNIRPNLYGPMGRHKDEISGDEIIEQAKKDFLYELNFFGRLKIVYLKEGEALGYIDWLPPNVHRAPRGTQTSFLDLNKHPVTVDINGEIILPYAATQFGYFSFQRLAYLTPKGYRPEKF